jgi:hypothetical protein
MRKNVRHEALIKAVERAIEDLFSDSTVSQDDSRADLREIIADCQMKIKSMGKEL